MIRNELSRLLYGTRVGETTSRAGLVRFIARCPGSAEAVLARAKQVLEVVLHQDPQNWPSGEAWHRLLPEWFVEQCAKEKSQEEADEWLRQWDSLSWEEKVSLSKTIECSLGGWVYWFQPEQRQWYWWEATILDSNTICVTVEIDEWPLAWGALDWLLRASGATTVEPEL
jgi:hypothetical protein